MRTDETPLYEHDCKVCRFLGRYTYDAPLAGGETQSTTVDLYICQGDALGPTAIARFSSEGHDYASTPVKLIERERDHMLAYPATHTPALLEVFRRARPALAAERPTNSKTITITLPDDVFKELRSAAIVRRLSGSAHGAFDSFTMRLIQLLEDGVERHTFQLTKKPAPAGSAKGSS